ncbi:hypothetical protein F4777DRAFT_27174 [Nemania sp. FL0916]|nr:hypothetical protein F4777DRAFT_27174 [Nemania sp. FL0916]
MPVPTALWRQQASAILHRVGARTRAHNNPTTAPYLRSQHIQHFQRFQRIKRFQTNSSNPPPPETHAFGRLLNRVSRFLPSRLRASLAELRSAPVSHITAFMILHEVTAILPIFILGYTFHVMDWTPTSWVLGPWAAWAEDGLKKYAPVFQRQRQRWVEFREGRKSKMDAKERGREGEEELEDGEKRLEEVLREEARREEERELKEGGKKRWFSKLGKMKKEGEDDGSSADGTVSTAVSTVSAKDILANETKKKAAEAWNKAKQVATVENTQEGYKLGIQIAAAYTITKFLLVPRIGLSLWMTPWLARGLIALRRSVWK